MGLSGNLNTMSVPELLGWVDVGRKSGTLEVERDKIIKRLIFRDGRLVACSSNDPATLMGHFLLARGAISRELLSQALARQEQSEENLGELLLEMGVITQSHRDAFVVAKIEETIYGLFDWPDAAFRFHPGALEDANALEVELEIRDVIETGMRRMVERELLAEVINDQGIVLRRLGEGEPPEIAGSQTARRIFALIDGVKTVKQILLHSHAPEFIVTKFLTALVHSGSAEVAEVRCDPPARELAEKEAADEWLDAMVETVEAEPPREAGDGARDESQTSPGARREYRPLADRTTQDSRELQGEINVALQLMSGGQPEAALELLNAMAAAHPGDVSLRQLVVNAEQDFCDKTLAGELRPDYVPTRASAAAALAAGRLSAEESFLLEQIDGASDVRSLLWVSPLREVDALKTLRRMLNKGWIEIRRAA
ncbi:MAG TPA: DUF4388 domain-containing protein [Candidatus Polarisedimenticolaceae bacterium]|nr:DUF4388 domain-containing protein [Candidatus Polarisedimenticolaceae bacterium]